MNVIKKTKLGRWDFEEFIEDESWNSAKSQKPVSLVIYKVWKELLDRDIELSHRMIIDMVTPVYQRNVNVYNMIMENKNGTG